MSEWVETFRWLIAAALPVLGWMLLPVVIVLGLLMLALERFKANYRVVGEKGGFRYYEHKFLKKRLAIRLTASKADEDWLSFNKDTL